MRFFSMFACFIAFATISIPSQGIFLSTAFAAPLSGQNAFLLSGQTPVADGKQSFKYAFVILQSNGSPETKFKGNLFHKDGKSPLSHQGKGVYVAKFTPKRLTSDTKVSLTLSGKTPAGKIKKDWRVTWNSDPSGSITAKATPQQVILGQDNSSTLTIEAQIPNADATQLILRSSAGVIDNVTNLGKGKFSARYTPPDKQYPHYALISMIDARSPTTSFGSFVLPQLGRANFPVNSIPDSNVILQIGDRSFGPVKANANGQVQIPIIVPPGVQQAKMISALANSTRTDTQDLQVPDATRIIFFPTPQSIPAEASTRIPIRLFAIDKKGRPSGNEKIILKSSQGRLEPAVHEGNGIYRSFYLPDTSSKSSQITLTASLSGGSSELKDEMKINLIPARAHEITLNPAAKILPKNAPNFKVTSKVLGPRKKPLLNQKLFFIGHGVRPADNRNLGSGDYSTTFTTNTSGPIEIVGHLRNQASKNPASGLIIDSTQERFDNDGISSVYLTIVSHDQYGSPVPNVAFQIKRVAGEAIIPSSGKTDEFGFAHLTLTAGNKAGPVRLQIYNDQLSSEYTFFQFPNGVASHLNNLPVSGSNKDVMLVKSWRKAIASVRVEREGKVGAKMTNVEGASGVIEAVEISLEPKKVAPNGKVTLKIKAVDNKGLPVSSAKIEAFAKGATISKMQELGGGTYQATLTAPANAKKTIKISVNAGDNISKFLKLPVVSTAGIKKEQSQGDDIPVRAMVALSAGSYGYQQVPSAAGGPLYEKSITFNNETPGASNAQSLGYGLLLRGTLNKVNKNLRYLGMELNFHGESYGVALDEFEGTDNYPIIDWINTLDVVMIPRYSYSINQQLVIHGGFRFGYTQDDFMIFTQSDPVAGAEGEDPTVQLSFEPLPLGGMLVGGELGVEAPMNIFGLISYDAALSGGTYRQKIDASIGYAFNSFLFAQTGFRSTIRDVMIEGSSGDAGELHDANRSFYVGFGYQLK